MITIAGIGPGDSQLRVYGVESCLAEADVVVGSVRQLDTLNVADGKRMELPRLSVLKEFVNAHLGLNIVLLASGDPLMYGIGTWAINNFGKENVRILPGISSIQYCFHRFGISENDTFFTSSHGRKPDFDFLLMHQQIGMVTDDEVGPYEIAAEIRRRKQHRMIYVGEDLSYPNEKLSIFDETNVENRKYKLNVVIIKNA